MLDIKGLDFSHGDRRLFAGFDFKLTPGTITVVKGASGCGKSTLLKLMLFYEVPEGGAISLDRKEVGLDNLSWYRSHFTYIGQKAPFYEGVVRDYLLEPFSFRANRAIPRPDDSELASRLAALGFPASEVLDRDYGVLSGGEQQRVTIAQALFLERPYLLLDEITSALDPENVLSVIELVASQRSEGKAAVVISHDERWEQFADNIVELGCSAAPEEGGL